ncbi:MAG: OB-fold nucleic acid binding domain-containing protein, partial [Patescibacteria group bacterium]
AMDRFGDRNQLLFNLESILEFRKDRERESSSGQFNLFAVATAPPDLKLKASPPANKRDMLAWEKELLGLYVSEHPFREYSERLKPILTRIADLEHHKKQKSVRIGGVVVQSKKIVTKNNEAMVFVKLEDLSGSVEVVVFPRTLKETADRWEVDTPLVVAGRPQEKDGEMKVLAETAFEITEQNLDEIVTSESAWKSPSEEVAARPPDAASITLHVRASLPETVLIHLRKVFDGYIGSHPVFFLIDDFDGQRRIKTSSKIVWNEEVVKRLEELLGKGTVKIS